MNTGIPLVALVFASGAAIAGITVHFDPADLDAAMGTPLLGIPDDGLPIGTLYGGMVGTLLDTPFGFMSFGPEHEKTALGTYLAVSSLPLAGSDIIMPTGAIAFDFVFTSLFPVAFVITAVGSESSSAPVPTVILTPGTPLYIGFAATDETIEMIIIETFPMGSTPPETWTISDMRVLPSPSVLALFGICALTRRRSR